MNHYRQACLYLLSLTQVTGSSLPSFFLARARGQDNPTKRNVSRPPFENSDKNSKAELSPECKILATSNNEFAFKLYAHLRTKKGNIVFSPYSISSALTMLQAGARGETAIQLANVLGHRLDRKRLGKAAADMRLSILAQVHEKHRARLFTANALWRQSGLAISGDYLGWITKYHDASIKAVNFVDDPKIARESINQWVENCTDGKIKNLILPEDLNVETRMILANALYFKAEWLDPFPAKSTCVRDFKVSANQTLKVKMMATEGIFGYYEDTDVRVLSMPYHRQSQTCLFVLPKKLHGIMEVEENLSHAAFSKWIRNLEPTNVAVGLPRISLHWECRLKTTLSAMGMSDAFSPKANFAGITSDGLLHLDEIAHKTFCSFTERGTEAASATAAMFVEPVTEIIPPKVLFYADHPLLFFILDVPTQSILFGGRIHKPDE